MEIFTKNRSGLVENNYIENQRLTKYFKNKWK